MISATNWVPRGFSSEFPEKYVLDEDNTQVFHFLSRPIQGKGVFGQTRQTDNWKKFYRYPDGF